ncbi:MAG: CRISPR-associated protein [Epsilonproteobacteria bacterium]|nr:CRISPR-associated protein [Campylobacterota bacterium]
MTLRYELTFYDYWHLSSGLSAGARLDSTVVKDSDSLPYAPAKTIKGLVREMAELSGDCAFVNSCFGGSSNDGKNGQPKDPCYDEQAKNIQGVCYFSNATLEEDTKNQIISNKLQENLYDIIASTKINEHGVAEDKSLREIEVVIPVTLRGEIKDIPDQVSYEKMEQALKKIKRMGLNRTRGLGRCEFKISKEPK